MFPGASRFTVKAKMHFRICHKNILETRGKILNILKQKGLYLVSQVCTILLLQCLYHVETFKPALKHDVQIDLYKILLKKC